MEYMNELQISTITLEPAKVEFNKEQVVNELKGILKKYENLVFTEENTTDIRKTLAELRKGRKTADDYRKDIKKQLTQPVTNFEKEMKEITALFDDVINPINEQLKAYEERRKEEKRQELQAFIDEVIEDLQLEKKFASQLVIEDSFLNKSASMTQTKESIEFKANNLLNEQKLEIMNRENIESFVKLQNAENSLNLSVVAYLSQLEYKDIEEVKKTIVDDVNKEIEHKEKQLQEIERKKEIEHKEKQLQEIERKAELEKEKIKQEIEFEQVEKHEETFRTIDDLPFGNIEEKTTSYTVYVTDKQRDLLIEFLTNNDIDYVEEMELPF